MMNDLLRRAEGLARAEQRKKLIQVAQAVKELLRGASIEVGEGQVLVSGRGILKRWMLDSSLRFLSGGLK